MSKTLIIRYHRIGDALITLPLIYELATTYKDDQFTVLSNKRFEYLFKLMPENVTFIPMLARSSTGMFRGVSFLIKRNYFEWKIKRMSKKFDKIAFLQIDRLERKIQKEIQKENLNIQIGISDETAFHSLERLRTGFNDGLTMVGLHKKAFSEIGYDDIKPYTLNAPFRDIDTTELFQELGISNSVKLIAIAPFAKETSKIYPLEKTEAIVAHFASQPDKYKVLLLGGGNREKKVAEEWVKKYPDALSLIERIPYKSEILLISKCAVTLSMDSSNMHLSAFLGTPVVSIWGATSPKVGFYPMNMSPENAISLNLKCQPCSFFGKEKCTNQTKYACFEISPETIIKKMEEFL